MEDNAVMKVLSLNSVYTLMSLTCQHLMGYYIAKASNNHTKGTKTSSRMGDFLSL